MFHNMVMCGIPRSGSTLIWQILQSIFPRQKIIKTHPYDWDADGSWVFASIRDPRDIAASLLRVRLSREGKKRNLEGKDIRQELKRMELNFEKLRKLIIGPHVILRYEEFYQNYDIIYDSICKTFNITIPTKIRLQLNSKFSLKNNKGRADNLKNFYDVDEWHVHGDHIGHIHPGYWKEFIPSWGMHYINKVCLPICKEWNYDE
ncbi:MAG: hypothetical protein ACTSO3_01255 [Candidatus Heimdallarchaeaceae archaeon]